MGITIASHNTMNGTFLADLLQTYRLAVHEHQLDVLCLQENLPHSAQAATTGSSRPLNGFAHDDGMVQSPRRTHADHLCEALDEFTCVCLPGCPSLATLVRQSFAVEQAFLVPLPLLDRLNWFERLYIRGGQVTQKFALVTLLNHEARPLAVVNFHLETAGNNAHRRRQVQAVADALAARGIDSGIVACGDTNVFAWSRASARHSVARVMEPLNTLAGAVLRTSGEATHFFARQREELLPHRVACLIGRLGVDHPLPYDVIWSDLHATRMGQLTTRESDHDLVFSELCWPL